MTGYRHTEKPLSEAYRLFFDALKYRSPVQIIRAAYEFFGMPVLLTDRNYQLIAMCPEEPIGEDIYDTFLKKRIIDPEIIERYQVSYLNDPSSHYEPFYSSSGLVENCPRIFGEVYFGSRIYGHFAVMMFEEPLFENDLACAGVLKQALEYVLVPRMSTSENDLSACLTNLLNPSSDSGLRLFSSEIISHSLPGSYALMVTPVGKSSGQHAFAAMNAVHFPKKNRSCLSVTYNGCIVTLFGALGKEMSTRDRIAFESYAAALKRAGRSGLSVCFEDLLTVPDHFYEGFLAADGENAGPGLFQEEMPGPLMKALCARINPSIFIHPVLTQVKKHDAENGTEYYETLRMYSFLMHDKEKTADALHIHRNTLLYRLNRAMELFSIAIEDSTTALYLLNSFQLQDMMDARQGKERRDVCLGEAVRDEGDKNSGV